MPDPILAVPGLENVTGASGQRALEPAAADPADIRRFEGALNASPAGQLPPVVEITHEGQLSRLLSESVTSGGGPEGASRHMGMTDHILRQVDGAGRDYQRVMDYFHRNVGSVSGASAPDAPGTAPAQTPVARAASGQEILPDQKAGKADKVLSLNSSAVSTPELDTLKQSQEKALNDSIKAQQAVVQQSRQLSAEANYVMLLLGKLSVFSTGAVKAVSSFQTLLKNQ